jgi:hypothetical protein
MDIMEDGNNPNGPDTVELSVWTAPTLIPLDMLAKAEKISYNTEHGLASGLS